LQGPSIAVDTMSASSMTALHMACEGLARSDCEMAIVASASVLAQDKYKGMSGVDFQMLGASAEVRSFANLRGALPAEGTGAILLKRAAKAMEEGDRILPAIRSTSYANTGRKTIRTAEMHAAIARAISVAGVAAQSIGYVESSATGNCPTDTAE